MNKDNFLDFLMSQKGGIAIILARIEQNLFQGIFRSIKYFLPVDKLLDLIIYYGLYHKDYTNIFTTIPKASLHPLHSALTVSSEKHLEKFPINKKQYLIYIINSKSFTNKFLIH